MSDREMTMVERVARAICPEYFANNCVLPNKAELQMFAIDKARDAVQAMSKPTKAVQEALWEHTAGALECDADPYIAWEAAIDAALSETSAKEP